jgi:hypothetical protein
MISYHTGAFAVEVRTERIERISWCYCDSCVSVDMSVKSRRSRHSRWPTQHITDPSTPSIGSFPVISFARHHALAGSK